METKVLLEVLSLPNLPHPKSRKEVKEAYVAELLPLLREKQKELGETPSIIGPGVVYAIANDVQAILGVECKM